MTNPVQVSVVLPVRNAGPYLVESVSSILSQTVTEFELLLVDDHSTDGAIGALDRSDRRLKIIPSRGKGVVAAFNTGLAVARGAFVARMDADDIALPERLSLQLDYLDRHPEVGIAGGCVDIFAADGVQGGNRRYQSWLNSVRSTDDIRNAMFIESPVPNPTALFRHDVITALGGYHDVDWPEDYDLYLRADTAGIQMGKPKPVILRWRDHDGRLTRNDRRYSLQAFRRVRAHFLVASRLQGRDVVIWGAGPTGKNMHDLLVQEGAHVTAFIDVHPRRIGGRKRDLPVWPVERAVDVGDALILVAVGAAGARAELREFMQGIGHREGEEYLFVA
jgi:glycosyltransferase involved in cell wall biosynthesis